ncbi:hypothetical protein V1525DRAFT_420427 [Lipomyces kononenkoae]|uniref:Uncharacterized protein n=1 Tax=Lipomyces kononenkoae TaxID=34357 RepID=A0ACC3SYQ1_LIPKO
MSLFGDDYESGSSTTARSSLFGEPESTPRSSMATTRSTVSSSGRLFDSNDNDPWSLPVPRTSQKPTIATLLDTTKVPKVYNDSFDAENPVGGVLTVENVRSAIDRAGLSNNRNADRIVNLIIRSKPDNRIDRGTWCVAMALIGLLQDGEEDLNLDAVDSRRYSLPVTKLRFPTRSRSAAVKPAAKTVPAPLPVAPSPAPSRTPSRQTYGRAPSIRSQPVSVPPLTIPQSDNNSIPPTAMTPPSPSSPPGISVADPWAAQDDDDVDETLPATYSNANNYSSNAYSSTNYSANNYTSNRYNATDYVADNYNSNYSSVLGADYNELARPANTIQNYSDEPIVVPQGATVVEDDDSDADEEEGEANGQSYVPNFPYSRAQPYYDAHEQDRIRVSIIPEKEGVFMFRHVNYLLEGAAVPGADGTIARGGYRVVRRYSDFVWLLNCLLKRFPFRILPLLPPKRFAVNGHYLSSDEFFLERRRRGLSRFINELAKHPVLSREQLVVMFLTVPTELAVWRKQASVSVEDEFTGRSLPDGLIESWNSAEAERWEEVKMGVKMEAELYTHLCLLIDRMEKRQESVALDHQRFASSLNTLQEVTQKTYSVDTNDLSLINDGINNVSKYLNNAQTLLEDESRGWEIGVLEDFKRHRDTLISIKELFDRQEKLDVNTIPYLERRISNNESRLTGMRDRSDFKQADVDRIQNSIQRDRESIKEQHTRTWLIKECMRDELAYFQQTKYRVAKLFQDYAQERLKYAELFAENWRVLGNEISEVPTSAS